MTTHEVALNYFTKYPEARNDVLKAYYAWHTGHYRLHLGAHNFTNGARYCACVACGRTREQVRYDDLPAQCENYTSLNIEAIILHEEERAHALQKRIPHILARLSPEQRTNYEFLHSTFGISRDDLSQ